jgi:hypothetical protein
MLIYNKMYYVLYVIINLSSLTHSYETFLLVLQPNQIFKLI